ncbi:Uncharacterized membrane protein [Modicisalibacter muralis]|uniref:Uncharacterized membrane protein n=1 Tax=Modicisalibacter muralis TaxID=119000 RepID=A0A1G9HYM4_9GAMM|nr:hypothetical protein [Halomonas muralis]SDL17896.1 Uncharacterized membrane protein [Halomonas muralis]
MNASPSARPLSRVSALTLLLGLLALAWPLLVHLLLPHAPAWPLLAIAVALVCWRLPAGHKRWGIVLAACAAGLAWSGHAELGVRAWPVLINAGLLGVFLWSLYHPPTLIERLARRQEPDLPPSGVRYTRRVTQVWCGFFAINGTLSLLTALYADPALWTLYNGGIAYVLSALLFAIEWCIRQGVKRRARHD